MTLRFEALIEHWPSVSLLFVRALPGFQVSGRDAEELQERVGIALQAHLDWLVARELIDQPSGEVDLAVVEQARSISESIGPLFTADLIAPNEEEVENALAVGRAALSDLIDAQDAPQRVGDDAGFESTLRHVAQMDRWYAGRLSGDPQATALADPIDDLVDAAGTFEDAVDDFAANGSSELFVRDGEEWTLAKALRRRTGHLREHMPTVSMPKPNEMYAEDEEFDDDDDDL
jgi:hypothetical protein